MVTALTEHLRRLLSETSLSFHEEIRLRVGKRATANMETKLKEMILLMPIILKGLWFRHGDRKLPEDLKNVISYALMHPYKPKDAHLKNCDSFFGYLDDAYSIGLLYEMTIQKLKGLRFQLTRPERDFIRKFKRLKHSVQIVIPYEANRMAHLSARTMAKKLNVSVGKI